VKVIFLEANPVFFGHKIVEESFQSPVQQTVWLGLPSSDSARAKDFCLSCVSGAAYVFLLVSLVFIYVYRFLSFFVFHLVGLPYLFVPNAALYVV
jgi:hypothetical protein